jgi:hypothetical protein
VVVTVVVAAACGCFLLRELGDEALGGDEQSADGCCVLQRAARDLCRVNDAGFHEVNPFAGGDVQTFVAFTALGFRYDERSFEARVVAELRVV